MEKDDVFGKAVREYVDTADVHHDNGTGLLLVGPAGTGKTYAVCALLNELPEKYSQRFYTLHMFLRLGIRAMQLEKEADGGSDKAFKQWKWCTKEQRALRNDVDFVVIDDVGMEHRTRSDWAIDEFEALVRQRFDNALPTLLTSNIPISRWGDVYGPAMVSFIREATPPVSVAGPDLRL